jgi:hypothetical protein
VIVRKNSLNKSFLAAIAIAVAIVPMAQAAPKTIAVKPFALLTKDTSAEGMVVTSKTVVTYANIAGKSSDIQVRAIDFAGVQIWSKTIDSGRDEVATAISVDTQGSIWLVGNSASASISETFTATSGALNPDSVTVEIPTEIRGDMKDISLWQFSPSGDLLAQIDLKTVTPALIDGISVNASGASILFTRESGQSLALVKAGKLIKEVKIGTSKSKFNAVFRGADGSTSLFGSSSETLGGKKLAGKVDGILLKVSKAGSISSVVRSSASGAVRDWQSATATNFLTGVVKSGKTIETAITKFNTAFVPTWTNRFLSTGTSLAASGNKSSVYAIFEPTAALKGVTGWKQRKGQSVALQFDSKGVLIGAFTDLLLSAPLVAGYSAESGLVVLTSTGDILRAAGQ